jgi:two-component system response regulator FixJ
MSNKVPLILIVDDDSAVRDSLKFSLELEGLAVRVCSSGADLLRHPDLDQAQCLVLDYHMPSMDGFQLLEQLGRSDARPPVILITGPVTPRVREQAARAGVAHILEKPLLDSALIDRIREVALR